MKKEIQYKYDNGVLICEKHKTPIGKNKRGFFCRKCQDITAEVQNDICTQSTKMDQG